MNITTLPTKVDPKIIIALRKAFGEFYDQNATSFTDQGANLSFQNVTEFVDYLYSPEIGIPKGTSAKWIGITLENWYETVTKAPEFTEPTVTENIAETVPDATLREEQKEELRIRQESEIESKQKAKADVENFIKRYKGRTVLVTPKADIPVITLSQDEKQTLLDYGKAAKNPEIMQVEIEKRIKEALPNDLKDEIPDQVIKNTAGRLVRESQTFSSYTSANDIPTNIAVMNAASPLTAIDPKNEVLNKTITDEADRTGFVKASQDVAFVLAGEHDTFTTLALPVVGGSENIAALYFGPNQITEFELTEDESKKDDGIELNVSDIYEQAQDIRGWLEKVKSKNIPSSFYQSTYVPSAERATAEEVTILVKKATPGQIFGFKNQSDYAKYLARARQLKVEAIGVGSISSLSAVYVAQGTAPLLTSGVAGLITSGGSFQLAQMGYLASYKSFSFVSTSGKLGLKLLSGTTDAGAKVFAFGAKFGGKATALVSVSTQAGTKIAASGILARLVPKIAAVLGLIGTPLGSLIAWLGTEVLLKAFNWAGPKIKKFINNFRELLFGGGIAAMALLPVPLNFIIGVPPTILGGAGIASSGISGARLAAGVHGIGRVFSFAASTALAGIGGPILFILLGFPVIVALILFIINSGAYIVPPSLLTSENLASPYIGIEKTANPSGPFQNSNLPLNITYTVTITAKKESLSNIKIDDDCQVINESGQDTCPSNLPSVPESISVGSPFTYTYNVAYSGQKFNDSIVINTVNITADTQNSGQQSTSGSASITIGKPPTDCLQIEGNWPSQYKVNLQSAIGTLVSGYSSYVSKVCSSFDKISLLYEPGANGQYWGWNDLQTSGIATIHFYKLGVGDAPNALYTLAHELGHSLASGYQTASIFATYLAYPGIKSEAPYCFYKDTINWNAGESMPEAIALRIIEPKCGSVQQKWPIHFKFLNLYVFN